jgi:hypothetical protein
MALRHVRVNLEYQHALDGARDQATRVWHHRWTARGRRSLARLASLIRFEPAASGSLLAEKFDP